MAVDMGSAVAYLMLDASNFNSALNGAQNSLTTAGMMMSSAGTTMTSTITRGLISLGQSAVETTATFESAMSQVQATKGIGVDAMEELNDASVNVMDSLSDLAKELGSTTKFSAVEAAEAINNMAMAGYSVQETYDALPTVLSLASAGAMDLDYATQLVANGLNVMGMEAADAAELADKLAVTASNAYGSVSDFGEGILRAGGQAKLANMSLTDTMTALGILGDNGISASEGGTMLRNTIKNLYTPTTEAKKALDRLGVTTANADGSLKDMQTVLLELGTSLDNLTAEERINAMSEIFDARTLAGANALLANAGERWDELSESIDNAGGAADRMAQTQLNNLNGRLTILKSSIEGLKIAFGEILLPIVESFVQKIQSAVDWLNNLDEGQKEMIVKLAMVAAALGPVLLVMGRLVALIGQMGAGFNVLGGIMNVKAALIVGAIAAIAAIFYDLYTTNEEFRSSVNESFGELADAASRFGQTFMDALEGLKEPIQGLLDKMAGPMADAFSAITDAFTQILDSTGPALEGLFSSIGELIDGIDPGPLIEAFGSFASTLGDLASAVLPIIIENISSIIGWLEPVFDIINSIASAVAEIAEMVEPVLEELAAAIGEVFDNLPVEGVLSAIGALVQSIFGIIKGAMPTILSLVRQLIPVITSVLNVLSPILSLLGDIITLAAQILSGDLKGAGETLSSIWGDVVAVVEAVWASIQTAFTFIGSLLEPVVSAIGDALNSVKEFVSSAFNSIGEFFTTTIPEWVQSFGEWFGQLPEKAGEALGKAARAVVDFGSDVSSWVTTELPQIIGDIVNWFASLPGAIWEWLVEAVNNVVSWGSDLYTEASQAASDAINAIVEWFVTLPEKFQQWFDDVIAVLEGIDLAAVGEEIISSLWSGLKSMWASVKSWFDGLSLNWEKFKAGFSFGFGGGGSFATGLDYVPRTMNVTVHRGERILTQQENEEYNKGGSIEVTTYQNDQAITELNGTMNEVLNAILDLRNMQISLDSKKVVGGLVNEVDRQLGLRAQRVKG